MDPELRKKVVDECSRELALNFDLPANSILALYGAKLGLNGKQMFKLLASEID